MVNKIPDLDLLVNLCFQVHSKTRKLLFSDEAKDTHQEHIHWDDDTLLAYQFARYVTSLHCEENLRFLIEIFKYEYLYDLIHPNNDNIRLNTPSPKLAYLSVSSSRSIDRLANSSKYTKKITRSHSLQKTTSGSSANTVDHEPTSVFVSSIDDMGEPNLYKEATTNVWDDLMEKEIGAISDESSLEEELIIDTSHISDETTLKLNRELMAQWDHIVQHYIDEDAQEQINISNKAYREILSEDLGPKGVIHNPITLLRAKNEVLRLIKENAYTRFVKLIQNEEPSNRCLALQLPCCTENSSKQSSFRTSSSSLSSSSPYNSILNSPHQSLTNLQAADSTSTILGTNALSNKKTHTRTMSNSLNTDSTPNNSANRSIPITPNASPMITPVQSSSQQKYKSKSHRLRHLASPTSSSGSSSSSLSAFLGHLKLNSGSNSGSQQHSQSSSPVYGEPKSDLRPGSPNSTVSNSYEEGVKTKFGRMWKIKK
ncbi:hypothetical protein CAAN1_01S10748 [[Candida] anglica]|uniref:RGS domain-containing protein n=1 Tax=[Candida] anglica TaxID=148631 RepID=A0ABP0EKB7_9ASCO